MAKTTEVVSLTTRKMALFKNIPRAAVIMKIYSYLQLVEEKKEYLVS